MLKKPANDPEYSIYVYHNAETRKEGQNDWEKKDTTTDFLKALRDARKLNTTGEYQKIEVKKKYYDSRIERSFETTLKSFEKNPARIDIDTPALLIFALACSLALLAVLTVLHG